MKKSFNDKIRAECGGRKMAISILEQRAKQKARYIHRIKKAIYELSSRGHFHNPSPTTFFNFSIKKDKLQVELKSTQNFRPTLVFEIEPKFLYQY